MERKELIIGIDYSDEYCSACYYSEKHRDARSVAPPSSSMRYLIPSKMCFCEEKGDWIIGEEAIMCSKETGAFLFGGLLLKTVSNEKYKMGDKEYPYSRLFAVFIEKLLEMIRTFSGIFPLGSVNIAMRRVNMDTKAAMEEVFTTLGVPREKIHLMNYGECFAYFIINEEKGLWEDGAQLFDYSNDGFFLFQSVFSREKERNILYVEEKNYSLEFTAKDVKNEYSWSHLDEKLGDLYDDVKIEGDRCSVFFTGSGFEKLWFKETLQTISQTKRAFRGNNIYARGACMRGRADGKTLIVCRPRTKASVSTVLLYEGEPRRLEIIPGAVNWYDAANSFDIILDESKKMEFIITSMLGAEETSIGFDLSIFPERPPKTTRCRVSARYINENECEICITDLGFGAFYPASGRQVRKILNLEGYI